MDQSTSPSREESKLRPTIVGLTAMFVILLLILYVIVMYYPEQVEEEEGLCPEGSGESGSWGTITVMNSTVIDIDFGKVTSDPRPTHLSIKLMRNNSDIGVYEFQSDNDGPLELTSGEDVGVLTYVDYADNQKLNVGDKIIITELSPVSDYVIALVWSPTGDCIATAYFGTP